MGEARRRHKAIGQPIVNAIDTTSGKSIPARYGGRFGEFLSKVEFAKPRDVPCNGCHNCCYHDCVDVYPDKEKPEDLAHLDLVPNPDGSGGVILRKKEDGACGHLSDSGGCTVYDHRPFACRVYDCRLFSAIGVVDSYNDGRTSPGWVFDHLTAEERTYELALRIGAKKHIASTPEWNSNTVLVAAFTGVPEAMPAAAKIIAAFEKLPQFEQERIRGLIEDRMKR